MRASGKMAWVGRGISGLVSALLLFSAAMKLTPVTPETAQALEAIGIRESMLVPLAVLEASCALVYLIPRTAVLGAILVSGYMGGAILTHWRVGDLFVLQALIGVLAWLGVWLRDERLRALIPLRASSAPSAGAPAEEPQHARAAASGR